jgi:hypothetical protein
MEKAIERINLWFRSYPDEPLTLPNYGIRVSTCYALARRGYCKITGPPFHEPRILAKNWHPDILHRLAAV